MQVFNELDRRIQQITTLFFKNNPIPLLRNRNICLLLSARSSHYGINSVQFWGSLLWNNLSRLVALRKEFRYSEFIWSVFPRIQTEYGEVFGISPHSVRMWENTDQKNSEHGHFLRSVKESVSVKELKQKLNHTQKIHCSCVACRIF